MSSTSTGSVGGERFVVVLVRCGVWYRTILNMSRVLGPAKITKLQLLSEIFLKIFETLFLLFLLPTYLRHPRHKLKSNHQIGQL